jgi:GGDEF domain-containing protein
MTEHTKNDSPVSNYLQKYKGTERRNDKIQNTALLELNFNFSSVHSLYGDESHDKIEQLLLVIEQRLHQRLRDTDIILKVNHKIIILLEEVEIIAHANYVSDQLVKMLKEPIEMAENHHIEIETAISINLFSKFDLKLAAFPRKIKLN